MFSRRGGNLKRQRVWILLSRKTCVSHAYQSDYDTAILVSGDRDYVPLVEKVKSLGKRVHIVFFDGR